MPVPVAGLTDAIELSSRTLHTCARRAGGDVVCWGADFNGQLGDGGTSDQSAPVPVVGLTDAIEVSAGASHTCARRTGNEVVCWGANGDGQLGDGTMVFQRFDITPVIGSASSSLRVASGSAFTCSLPSLTAAACWGANASGQLGDGTTTPSAVPVSVSGL